MYPVKQNAGLNILFFLHDDAGDAVTGATFSTRKISKNGADFGTLTPNATEKEAGWYLLALTSSETDTLGVLTIYLLPSSGKQVNLQFRVHARLPDDLAFPNTSGRGVEVSATGGVAIDWSKVENPTSSVGLSGTTVGTVSVLTNHTPQSGDSYARIGAGGAGLTAINLPDQTMNITGDITGSLSGSVGSVTGNVDGSVNSVTTGVTVTTNNDKTGYTVSSVGSGAIVNTSFANNAIDNAAIAAAAITDVEATSVGSVTGAVGSVTGAVGSVTTAVTVDTLADDTITAASIAQNAIDSDAIDNTAVSEINANILSAIANLAAEVGTAGNGLTAIPWNAAWDTEVQSEVVDALTTETISELSPGVQPTTPTYAQALMLQYMALRNKLETLTSESPNKLKIYNSSNVAIAQKQVADNGTDYTELAMEAPT